MSGESRKLHPGVTALILLTTLGLSYATCQSCGQDIEDARQSAEESARHEAHELDERREKLQNALCHDSLAESANKVFRRLDGQTGYVRPEVWQNADLDAREYLSAWVGLCHGQEDDSIIVDGMTGETIAFWYLKHGYRPQ